MKRRPAGEFDRSQPIPLKEVINFGPITLAEFESIGITTLDQIEQLGLEETVRLWVRYYPERLNANAIIAIIATLDGVSWTKATISHREQAAALVRLLKTEFKPN